MSARTATIGQRRHLVSRWISAFVLAGIVTAAAAAALIQAGHDQTVPLASALAVLFVLMVPYAAFLTTSFARDVGARLRTSPSGLAQMVLAFVAVYLVYGVGTGTLSWASVMRLALFVAVPTALIRTTKGRGDVTWQDFAAVACIWLPFDAGLLKELWTWPEGGGAYILNTAVAVDLAVALFAGFRGFAGVSPRLRVGRRDVGLVALALATFLAIAVPFGYATGFVTWNPQVTALKAVMTPIGIFLFIALPEELLFRGLVQNFIERKSGRPAVALACTAVIFGATHLNNGPSPDWRYFVLATVAGFFYGAVYRRTRGLTAPAMLHAAVDALWVLFLHT